MAIVFLISKLGWPMAILLVLGLVAHLWRGLQIRRAAVTPFHRAVIGGACACLCASLFVSWFGNQFGFREGVIFIAIAIGLIGFIESRYGLVRTGVPKEKALLATGNKTASM